VIEKEIRALFPLWIGCAALLAASPGVYPLKNMDLPLYFMSIAALGAFSMGHEYSYSTLGFALAQPVPRRRIWLTKLGVLLPLVASLALLAAWRVDLTRGDRTFGAAIFWLPALAAFFIAPWLTMLARGPLAGMVFTVAIVGASMTFGEWIGIARYGFTANVDRLRVAFMWWTVGGLSLVGAIAGWRLFARLEDAGPYGADVQLLTARLARPRAGAPARRHHPLVALVRKELRLQQLALVIAALYVAGAAGTLLWGRLDDRMFDVFSILTAFYVMVVPAAIGSLAAAEERQFGTHDAQLLLPVAASTQWMVKVATALALSVALAVLLPLAVKSQLPEWALREAGPRGLRPGTLLIVLGCASIGLYVSTLARSGLSAMVYSSGAISALGYFTWRIGLSVADKAFELTAKAWRGHVGRPLPISDEIAWFVLLGGFVLLVARLALANYRYSDRSPARVALHAAAITGAIAACAVVFGVVSALQHR